MPVEGLLRISTAHEKGAVVVECEGELDMASSERLRDQVEGCLDEAICSFVLDCSGVTFIDSMGVKCLLHAASTCFGRGIGFALVQSPQVRRVVEALGVLDRLPGAEVRVA